MSDWAIPPHPLKREQEDGIFRILRPRDREWVVLCPPHLAEQWQRELAEKFHIEADLVLSGTIRRLEHDLALDDSVFDGHPFTVVSTDFIKTPQRAEDFALKRPEFVIVDEAFR